MLGKDITFTSISVYMGKSYGLFVISICLIRSKSTLLFYFSLFVQKRSALSGKLSNTDRYTLGVSFDLELIFLWQSLSGKLSNTDRFTLGVSFDLELIFLRQSLSSKLSNTIDLPFNRSIDMDAKGVGLKSKKDSVGYYGYAKLLMSRSEEVLAQHTRAEGSEALGSDGDITPFTSSARQREALISPNSRSYYACVGESSHTYQTPSKDLTSINNRLKIGRKVCGQLNFDAANLDHTNFPTFHGKENVSYAPRHAGHVDGKGRDPNMNKKRAGRMDDEGNVQVNSSWKKRGKTALIEQVEKKTKKMPIKLNELNQPCEGNTKNMTNWIGILARRHIPIHYKDWRVKELKNLNADLHKNVLEKFNITTGNCESWILSTANDCWRRYKQECRKSIIGKSIKDSFESIPIGMEPSDWLQTIKYWESEAFKEKSALGKHAQSFNIYKHSLGSTTIAEMAESTKSDGFELWKHCRTKKDGKPTNDDVSKMIANVEEYIENEECATCTEPQLLEKKTKYLEELLPTSKYRGKIRGIGKGPTFMDLEKDNEKRDSFKKYEAQVEERITTQVEAKVEKKMQKMIETQAKLLNFLRNSGILPQSFQSTLFVDSNDTIEDEGANDSEQCGVVDDEYLYH